MSEHFGCARCPEPKTTIEHGDHIAINVTSTNYGAKVIVVVSCSVCGYVRDMTEHVKQVSYQHIKDLITDSGDNDLMKNIK